MQTPNDKHREREPFKICNGKWVCRATFKISKLGKRKEMWIGYNLGHNVKIIQSNNVICFIFK